MSMNLQDLGATEIVAIVIATGILALAIVGFLKGLIRTVMALLCLGIAGYAGLWGYEHSHDFTDSWSAIPSIWAPKIVALITGTVVFIICRYVLRFLVDPFNQSEAGKKIGFGLPAAALSLCAGLALIWLGFTGVRYATALSELHDTRRVLRLDDSKSAQDTSALLHKIHTVLDSTSIGKWQRATDPFYASGKLALSKLLVMYYDEPTRLKLLADPKFNELLNSPTFIQLISSEDIKKYAISGKPREIYNSPELLKALNNQDFRKLFFKIISSDQRF